MDVFAKWRKMPFGKVAFGGFKNGFLGVEKWLFGGSKVAFFVAIGKSENLLFFSKNLKMWHVPHMKTDPKAAFFEDNFLQENYHHKNCDR